jgi:hypothetical protein
MHQYGQSFYPHAAPHEKPRLVVWWFQWVRSLPPPINSDLFRYLHTILIWAASTCSLVALDGSVCCPHFLFALDVPPNWPTDDYCFWTPCTFLACPLHSCPLRTMRPPPPTVPTELQWGELCMEPFGTCTHCWVILESQCGRSCSPLCATVSTCCLWWSIPT